MTTLSLQETAERMKVHPKTVLTFIKDGRLPAAKFGRAYVILEKDVDALIEGEIVKQTAERLDLPPSFKRRVRRSPKRVGQVAAP